MAEVDTCLFKGLISLLPTRKLNQNCEMKTTEPKQTPYDQLYPSMINYWHAQLSRFEFPSPVLPYIADTRGLASTSHEFQCRITKQSKRTQEFQAVKRANTYLKVAKRPKLSDEVLRRVARHIKHDKGLFCKLNSRFFSSTETVQGKQFNGSMFFKQNSSGDNSPLRVRNMRLSNLRKACLRCRKHI